MDIKKEFLVLKDQKYADFQSKLIPSIEKVRVIGVRIPEIRKIAKKYIKETESNEFLDTLPHYYFEENVLHGLMISEIKNLNECLMRVEKFLPYVDNWAVCDTMSPKVFKNNKEELIKRIKIWVKSHQTYTCRFGIGMLMKHYLDGDYKKEYLDIPASICSEEYYVNMMVAWFFATALAKHWDDVVIYIKDNKLNKWVHNKTIQKAIESFRITPEQKEYLKSLKR